MQSSALVIDRLKAAIVLFWCRPDGHGSAADAPAAQYEPAVHVEHAVAPSSSWYLPTVHFTHEPCSACGCIVPGLHAVGSADPVEHDVPAGHVTQSSTLVIKARLVF